MTPLAFLTPQSAALQGGGARERVSFNAGWRFRKDDPAGAGETLRYDRLREALLLSSEGFLHPEQPRAVVPGSPGGDVEYVKPEFDDRGWRPLDLPHDWGIEGPFKQEYPGETGKLPWWGVGWYRKHFDVPASDRGRQVYLDVDGAMSYAAAWVNGHFVGGWPYGYASFRLDLTPFIRPGAENVLAIRLDNPPDSSRWYPGGGLYRNVWLVKTAPVHVAQWGTFVTSAIEGTQANVTAETRVRNDGAAAASVRVRSTIRDAAGKVVAREESAPIRLEPGREEAVRPQLAVKAVRRWSLQEPHRYTLLTEVAQAGRVVDSYSTPFGVRTIAWDPARGFLLNGELVRLNGVCMHHDLGALGAAMYPRALERQLEILRDMGCNAIRTSHNPPAPELVEFCDRMGLLVIDEFADTWKQPKKPNGYARLFDDWSERDLRALVRRDRNHPCVVMWSTGNEIPEQRTPPGAAISQRLTDIVHSEDRTRPVTAACNFPQAGFNGFQKTLDIFGYNYKPNDYRRFREANPAQPIYGSETASTVSSRGEYFFPVSENKLEGRADFQVSSYDLYAPPWATPPDWEFKGQDQAPFAGGEFVWTGFDYLGEPTPYNNDTTNLLNFNDPAERARAERELKELGKVRVPSRSSYFGIVDLAGFKKDRFYIYQARWRPDLPMAHLLPHWNWPERAGQVTPVHVYTSGDEAELFLNGRSLGRKQRGPEEYRLRWHDVVYEPGELRVVAYRKGKPWAEAMQKTTGPAAQVTLRVDRPTIAADGRDLAFVTATVADREGLAVPRSKNHLRFELDGPGELAATDNGDATDHTLFQAKERNAYNGLALAIVRSRAGEAGTIRVRVSADGLRGSALTVTTRKNEGKE